MDRRFTLAFLMPVVLGIVVFLICVSLRNTHPKQDFVFSLTPVPFCAKGNYVVQQKRLVWRPRKISADCGKKGTTPTLYRYSMANSRAELLGYRSSKFLTVDPSDTSSEGFKVMNLNNRSGNIVPDGSSMFFTTPETYVLSGPGKPVLLQIPTKAGHYQQFEFLGWVQS